MSVSPTLAVNEEIARRRARGLATVALGFGEASIPVHPALVERLGAAAGAASYGPVAGLPELREAVAGYLSRRDVPTEGGQVLAGPGTKPLLYAVFRALGGPVALPRPSWVTYAAQTAMLGLATELVPTPPGQGGVPDPDLLDAVAARLAAAGTSLRVVLVTIPDNPTGTVAAADVVRRLCEVAVRHDLVIVCDEIYGDLVHDGSRALTPSSLVPDRTIVTTGLSKNLALGGWRIGAARFPAALADVRAAVEVVASEVWSAPAHPVQRVAAWAFTEPDVLAERVAASRVLHGRVARAVADCFTEAGWSVPPPTAAFYLYPTLSGPAPGSSDALARTLLHEHGIATLPGTAFGDEAATVSLRVATPMLYGSCDKERLAALGSDDPARLPWVAADLDTLRSALRAVERAA